VPLGADLGDDVSVAEPEVPKVVWVPWLMSDDDDHVVYEGGAFQTEADAQKVIDTWRSEGRGEPTAINVIPIFETFEDWRQTGNAADTPAPTCLIACRWACTLGVDHGRSIGCGARRPSLEHLACGTSQPTPKIHPPSGPSTWTRCSSRRASLCGGLELGSQILAHAPSPTRPRQLVDSPVH